MITFTKDNLLTGTLLHGQEFKKHYVNQLASQSKLDLFKELYKRDLCVGVCHPNMTETISIQTDEFEDLTEHESGDDDQ